MRLSESLRRGVMETFAGGVINRFKLKGRRDVFFFEDILANFIKECESAGYCKQMEDLARDWMNLTINYLPAAIKKMPVTVVFNIIGKKIWINLGLLDDIKLVKKNDVIYLRTRNECITRVIGKNRFAVGFYKGMLEIVTQSEIENINYKQTVKESEYEYLIKKGKPNINLELKDKKYYNKLIRLRLSNNLTIKNVLKKHIFILKNGNKIYFRGKLVSPVENTLFHLFGNNLILPKELTKISYNFFKGVVSENSTKERKTILLKFLFQSMGWGLIKIKMIKGEQFLIEVMNPPIGLQAGKDNWNFLAMVMLGYLQTINPKLKVEGIENLQTKFTVIYG